MFNLATLWPKTKLLGFNPLVMAASALLEAAFQMFPAQFPTFELAMRSCVFINNANFKFYGQFVGGLLFKYLFFMKRETRERYEIQTSVKMDGCDLVAERSEQSSEIPVSVPQLGGDCELAVGCSSDGEDLKKPHLS